MNHKIWYLLVTLTLVFLIVSFLTKNIYFAIACFFMATYLNKYTKEIPLPKVFEKFNVVHFKQNTKDK